MESNIIIEKLGRLGAEALSQEEKTALKNMATSVSIHNFLSKIPIEDIELRRENARSFNFKRMNDEELFNAIMNAISFNVDGIRQSVLMQRGLTYPPKTRLYRIRSLDTKDSFVPLKAMSKEQDAWNAPEDLCRVGRINKEGESLLYTSPSPNVCVEEMNIENGERFCLIVYESIKSIKATLIGIWEDNPDLSKEDNLKMRMITNILGDLFTKEVGKGTEHLYRVSERIAKDNFDLPRDTQDAWCYPSIDAKLGYNLCFRPDVAKELLKLIGVQVCTVKRVEDNYFYSCQVVAKWNENTNSFDYFPVNSPQCKQMFPEIQVSI